MWRTKDTSSSSNSAQSSANTDSVDSIWDILPPEVQFLIFGHLDARSLMLCGSVSQSWKEMTQDNWLWDNKIEENWRTIEPMQKSSGDVPSSQRFVELSRLERNWRHNKFKLYRMAPATEVFLGGPTKCLDFRENGYLAFCEKATASDSATSADFDSYFDLFQHEYQQIRNDCMIAAGSGTGISIQNIWEENGGMKKSLRGHASQVSSVAFAGAHHLISGDSSGLLLLWDLYQSASLPWSTTSSELVGFKKVSEHSLSALSIFDSRILYGTDQGDIGMIDLNVGVYPLATVDQAHQGTTTSFSSSRFSPEFVFASCSRHKYVKVWDQRTFGSGKPALTLFADSQALEEVQFGVEYQLLTCGYDGVQIFDIRMPAVIYSPFKRASLGMCYNGSRLVVGTENGLHLQNLGSMGVPEAESDIDTFLAQQQAQRFARGEIDEPRLPYSTLPIDFARKIFASASYMVCLRKDSFVSALDFSPKPKINRRLADSTYNKADDYIGPTRNQEEDE